MATMFILGVVLILSILVAVVHYGRRKARDEAEYYEMAVRFLQRGLLPEKEPEIQTLAIASFYLTPEERIQAGGDFYDFIALPGDETLFVIGDASGHGLSVVYLARLIRDAIRSFVIDYESLADLGMKINDMLLREAGVEEFATLCLALYSAEDRTFEILNAGAPLPALVSAGEGTYFIGSQSHNPLCGVMPLDEMSSYRIKFHPGDELLFYTDGLVEQAQAVSEFGEKELLAVLKAHAGLAPKEILKNVYHALLKTIRTDLTDDVTMLLIKGRPSA